ncbi:hypothetical protein [Thioalkalivibrio sp. ALMg11]|uniref:hypothetical protein n=1 Tax=Thioalkalivibrio sp. ALMg11 TaxID=1158165 RepID=UPI00036F4089|nr:hypothetical protein [Thioalkalivibrio sp. ALMg11]
MSERSRRRSEFSAAGPRTLEQGFRAESGSLSLGTFLGKQESQLLIKNGRGALASQRMAGGGPKARKHRMPNEA